MTSVKGSWFIDVIGYFYLSFLDSDTIQFNVNSRAEKNFYIFQHPTQNLRIFNPERDWTKKSWYFIIFVNRNNFFFQDTTVCKMTHLAYRAFHGYYTMDLGLIAYTLYIIYHIIINILFSFHSQIQEPPNRCGVRVHYVHNLPGKHLNKFHEGTLFLYDQTNMYTGSHLQLVWLQSTLGCNE